MRILRSMYISIFVHLPMCVGSILSQLGYKIIKVYWQLTFLNFMNNATTLKHLLFHLLTRHNLHM